jgi:hypothetical protein
MPDFKTRYWGDSYARLSDIKTKYDPNHVFNCYNCVEGTNTNPEGKTSHLAVILGSVVLGLVLIAVIGFAAIKACQKKRNKHLNNQLLTSQ